MAEAVARRELAKRGWTHVSVSSAGVSALTGLPATEGARKAAETRGLDLSDHGSAQLTAERIERADLVLAMTRAHVGAIEELGGEGKVALLGAFAAGEEGAPEKWSVPDPFGGDEAVYRETLTTLERMISAALSRLEPVLAP